MGRLPALIFALSLSPLASLGCDKSDAGPAPPPPPTSRHEAVRATGNMPTSAPTQAAAPHATAPAAAPRKLCDGQLTQPGRALPSRALSHAEAPGAVPLGEAIPTGGRWTWVNFWAAWCGPCKEEMPRLKTWEAKLAAAGTPITLAFVSLDDDQRQLSQFIGSQSQTGVRASYWLPDGPSRDGWLSTLKLRNPPDLPAHVLVDPAGQVRCTIQGAVDDGDYAQVAAIVARR